MKIKTLSDSELITTTQSLVREEREVTAKILTYLREIDVRRLYLDRGFSSLFSFCTEFLKYEESQAQRRINACRLLAELPEIETKIESGELSLTALSQAQSFFRQEAKSERPLVAAEKIKVLASLENKSTRECERELIKLNPDQKDVVELKLTLERSTMEKLKKLKDLYSHDEISLPKLIDIMADHLLAKKDPAAPKRNWSQKVPAAPTVNRNIPKKIKRQVWRRDQDGCQFQDPVSGRKCRSKFKLEIDHIEAFALGGDHSPENLRLLCRNHNRHVAVKTFGKEKMAKYF